MKKQQQTVESIKDEIRTLVAAMASVDGFDPSKRGSPMPQLLSDFGDMLEKHSNRHNAHSSEMVLAAGRQVLDAGRNILGKFLINSAVDRVGDHGDAQPSFFSKQIAYLRDVEKYDPDIIEGLEKKKQAVLDAIKSEKNGTFELRVKAYAAMKQALAEAEAEQDRRDRQPAIERSKAKQAKWAKEAADATARNRARDESARQNLLAERRAEANEFRNMLKK